MRLLQIFVLTIFLSGAHAAIAAQITLKDGTTYEGHILGKSGGYVLIDCYTSIHRIPFESLNVASQEQMNTFAAVGDSVVVGIAPGLTGGVSPQVFSQSTGPDLFATLSARAAESDDAVSGTYSISHAEAPGSRHGYPGQVAIAKDGVGYRLAWRFPNSSGGHEGIALLVDNILCSSWGPTSGHGVIVYKVKSGKLFGQWISAGSPEVIIENLEGPEGLNGVYKITEGSYTGTVEIRPSGKVYSVLWETPGGQYTGVGILKGDLLMVGWGTNHNAGIVYYEVGDGKEMQGYWTTALGTDIGIENLRRN